MSPLLIRRRGEAESSGHPRRDREGQAVSVASHRRRDGERVGLGGARGRHAIERHGAGDADAGQALANGGGVRGRRNKDVYDVQLQLFVQRAKA